MKRLRRWMNTLMLGLALPLAQAATTNAAVERVDPPHWWVGMR